MIDRCAVASSRSRFARRLVRPACLFAACVSFVVCGTRAEAQVAFPAGHARTLDVSLGYAYTNHPTAASTRIGLGGFDAAATVGLSSRLAVRLDFGYARSSSDVFGTPATSSVLSYLVGPVFHPTIHGKIDTYAHVLLGGARVSGPVPVSGGVLVGGWAAGFAWAVGGGVEYRLSDTYGLRGGLDLLRAGYFGPSLQVQGQSNIRATISLVYSGFDRWGRRRRR